MACLEAYPEPVSQSIDEVEIGRDLDGLQDAAIVQPRVAKGREVPAPDLPGLERQLLGECEDRAQTRLQVGLPPVFGESPYEVLIPGDRTERRPVM